MNTSPACPYCQSPTATPCPHLALVTEPRDFVRRCIESCHGEAAWKRLCREREKEDFTWLETAFAERFFKPLVWFGSVQQEWRKAAKSNHREPWLLLWSPNPQKFWWELHDKLEYQANIASFPTAPDSVRCPVCGKSPVETECEHLILHGEELLTTDILLLFNPKASWSKLQTSALEIPDDAATFLAKFGHRFPSLAGIESKPWNGESLGFTGTYLYVWVKDPAVFEREIGKFLTAS